MLLLVGRIDVERETWGPPFILSPHDEVADKGVTRNTLRV